MLSYVRPVSSAGANVLILLGARPKHSPESGKLLPTALRVVAPGILGDVGRRRGRLATRVAAFQRDDFLHLEKNEFSKCLC